MAKENSIELCLQNFSDAELHESCWAKLKGPLEWNHVGDYAMDFPWSPLDSILKECTSANLNKLNKSTLLNRIKDSIPVSEILNIYSELETQII
jgi:hypothetical protein